MSGTNDCCLLHFYHDGICKQFPSDIILEAPVNTSAPLGSNATFYCAVTQAEISWRLHGDNIRLNDDSRWMNALSLQIYRGEIWSNATVNSSVLIVTATESNNGTKISCFAKRAFVTTDTSADVQLTVFGMWCNVIHYGRS